MVISTIASTGLRLDKFNFLPPAKNFAFDGPSVCLSIDKASTYYVPLRFNLKAIDLLFASIDLQKKTAHLVPTQIAVAKQHKDSKAAFFADWGTWLLGLESFKVKTTFLWIHHSDRGRYEVEEKLRNLRGGTNVVHPNYEVLQLSIEQITWNLQILL